MPRGRHRRSCTLAGHGEREAAHTTFGRHEARGVDSELRWLTAQAPGEKIGAISVSLGAASITLCDRCPLPAALVLESMYPTIEDAVTNRLRTRVGAMASLLQPLLLAQVPLRLGIPPERLRRNARSHAGT